MHKAMKDRNDPYRRWSHPSESCYDCPVFIHLKTECSLLVPQTDLGSCPWGEHSLVEEIKKQVHLCGIHLWGVVYHGTQRKVSDAVLGWGMAMVGMGWGCQGRNLPLLSGNPLFPSGTWHAMCVLITSLFLHHKHTERLLQHQNHCRGLGIRKENKLLPCFQDVHDTVQYTKQVNWKWLGCIMWNCQYLATSYLLKSPFCMVQSITQ